MSGSDVSGINGYGCVNAITKFEFEFLMFFE